MTTARQLFKSACDEAVASQELRGVSSILAYPPLEKIPR